MHRLRVFVSTLAAATSLALAPAARAADEAAAHAHGKMNPAQAELGATAAFDASGTLWAVHKISGHLAVSHSTDRGRLWSNPVLVTTAPEPTDPGGDARPKIALGPKGEIYLTWTRPLAQPYTGEIRFACSLDGGRTFSVPVVVHRDRQIITHRFDTLAVNARGQLFVAWIDKRDLAGTTQGKNAAYAGAALYYAVSDDRGATFRGDFKVADHCCECCRIALAPRPDGSVTAFWRHIFPPNVRDHALATLSTDGKAGPVQRATFEDWRIDACPHHGPAIASDERGGLHGVWFSAAPEHRGVFYGRLVDGRVEGQRRIGGELAGHADVAVRGRDVAVVWKTFADDRTQVRGMISHDGGGTWTERELATVTGPADHPTLLLASDGFRVFWNTCELPLLVTALQ